MLTVFYGTYECCYCEVQTRSTLYRGSMRVLLTGAVPTSIPAWTYKERVSLTLHMTEHAMCT